jgi:hypothetical protein
LSTQRLIGFIGLLALAACGGGSEEASPDGVLTGSLLAPECGGGYAITQASVEVRDETDTLIGATTTGSDLQSDDSCRVEFTVTDLPGARFYQITIGSHDAPAYSHVELQANGWHVELTLGNTARFQTSSAQIPSPSASPTPSSSIDPAEAGIKACVALAQITRAISALQESDQHWPEYQEILREALSSLDPYVYYYKSQQPDLGTLLEETWLLANTVSQKAPIADRIAETPQALRSAAASERALECA